MRHVIVDKLLSTMFPLQLDNMKSFDSIFLKFHLREISLDHPDSFLWRKVN